MIEVLKLHNSIQTIFISVDVRECRNSRGDLGVVNVCIVGMCPSTTQLLQLKPLYIHVVLNPVPDADDMDAVSLQL